jgi:hypothetical protein
MSAIFFVRRLPASALKDIAMPTDKRSLRILLNPSTEREVIAIANAEGRALASVCVRLIEQALYEKRRAKAEVEKVARLASVIRGEASA